MTSRNRYFLIGALLVLVAGLGVGVVAYYTGALPGSPAARLNGPAELRYVPADASLVAYADVRGVMQSRFRQQMLKVEPDEQGRRQFEAKTGIDVQRDIDHVVACVTPGTGADRADRSSGLVLASGRFDQAKIAALLQEKGAQKESYGGVDLFTQEASGHMAGLEGGPHWGLAFLAPGTVAIGSLRLVKSAIDLRNGRGANVTSNAELMKLIRANDQGTTWAVGRFDQLREQARIPDQVASRIPPITWFSVAGHVDDGISGTLRAETRDDQAAENLRQVVQGFVALARMQAGSQPDLASVLQSVQLSGTGREVSLSFAVPARVLERIPGADHRRDGDQHPRP
ncbi:MAG: hypothetical protein KGN76_16275 [Acidobacteriota bacterium]|nr:hypothetical protein [Acidobacteriota bacterium]